jgi:predicted NAD/FAD-binding protein
MIRFCHNHGLIQVSNRPQWWTVTGGARQYVERIIAKVPDKRLRSPVQRVERDEDGVTLTVNGQPERFDKVVLACHSDQALRMLAQPSPQERLTLEAIRYQANMAVLHTDTSVLPKSRRAWAAWNYQRPKASSDSAQASVCLHYLINRLQPLPFEQPVVVSLNPIDRIDPALIHGTFEYDHPVFDVAAIKAQRQVRWLQGQQHTYFCGAWTGYGFHEDGLKSGLEVAKLLVKSLQAEEALA